MIPSVSAAHHNMDWTRHRGVIERVVEEKETLLSAATQCKWTFDFDGRVGVEFNQIVVLSLTKKTREEVAMNRKVDDLFQFDKSCIALQFPNAFAALITC